ncbi:MAG: bifunctional phosphopantothenoylcysteine decarboxylase/phosphopantothenate--cysteine ligase CoaBC [Phormidesmis sp.]
MNVLIGVSGGVAAYKVCEVVSTLAKAGVVVRVMMTDQAQRFVSPVTFAALSRQAVHTDADFWSSVSQSSQLSLQSQLTYRPLHIALGEWADALVIAPLTANTLAKLAHGLADNLLTNTVLASVCPVLLAPAMNTDMWQQKAVGRNWAQLLADDRYHAVGPGAGRLACDRVGTGRMAEPAEIVAHITSLLHTKGRTDLTGKQVLISAGSTHEHIDPVRFIGNPATGRMGIALALAAQHRGAQVTLVHGPLSAELAATLPAQIQTVALTSAAEMEQAMLAHLPQANWIIMAAAVADVRPLKAAASKLPKADLPSQLPLEFVPDIVAQLAARRAVGQTVVGFAAQTGDIVTPAIAKLKRKQLDVIVANPVDRPNAGFGSSHNEAVILSADGRQAILANSSKLQLAHQLYDFLQQPFDRELNNV